MLALVIGLFVGVHLVWSCPTGWVNCARDNELCKVPHNVDATTIAFGADKKNMWTYTDVTNGKGKYEFQIRCNSANFGDIIGSEAKECCFNPIYSNSSQTLDPHKWSYACDENGNHECAFPYSNGYARYVKYCSDDGQQFCSYRLMDDDFYCAGNSFAQPMAKNWNKFKCYYFDDVFNVTEWYACGDNQNKGAQCTMDMDTTDNNMIRATKMCFKDQDAPCQYRWSYHGAEPMSDDNDDDTDVGSYDEGVVPCDAGYYGYNDQYGTKYCYVLSYAESSKFVGPLGYWNPVSQCDCPMSETLSYGVTSTSTESTTIGWQETFTSSIAEEVSVKIFWVTESTTYTATKSVQKSISHTMTQSMAVSVTQSCEASCGAYGNGTYIMYQWIVTAGEYIGTQIKPFDDYACVFFCSNSRTAPQCPPGYCANWDCTVCYPWKSSNATVAAKKNTYSKWEHSIPIDEESRAMRLKEAMNRN